MSDKIIKLSDEQLSGVVGGQLLVDGRISYEGKVFALSTVADYENVLAQYGENFGSSVYYHDAEDEMWRGYYDWYYDKFNKPHNRDNR